MLIITAEAEPAVNAPRRSMDRARNYLRHAQETSNKIVGMTTPFKPPAAAALTGLAVLGLAMAGTAVGAMAIGALAIGKLALGKGQIDKLRIRELTVDRLVIRNDSSEQHE